MASPSAGPTKSGSEVRREIEAAFESHEVVLFMKGTELMPQCGYSRAAVNIVKSYRDEFEVINVLSGPVDVYRDELEARSDWTTIPQLFVDGSFIGGADVVEELHKQDRLKETLDSEPTEAPF